MNEIIELKDITIEKIAEIFDKAAIDHEPTDDGQIYVTGHPFNFWARIDEKKGLLIFWSYWEFAPDVDELSALRFCNMCNHTKVLVQFSKSNESERFYGHYMLPIREGINPKTLLRMAQRFSAIIDECVQAGINEGVLVPFNCSDDTCATSITKH